MNQELPANTHLSHYRIVSKLGAGGMGEVYLASDARLDRKVAIKLLADDFNKDPDRLHRFIREARAASALNHPNILTIYEVGETDGKNYIVTEYIEGETLRHSIQHQSLNTRDALDAVVQVASALAAAHQAGIIHRDIKPENVMLRPDGFAKVLDFGLAKLDQKPPLTTNTDAATVAKKDTNPGTIMGTVQYMSPEQARGKAVDARTDIFSLGVVLYELIAGRVPFSGESSTEVLAAILHKEPLPLARFAADVPAELQRIANKSLRKSPDDRYQTMKDFVLDLKELRDELALEAKLERSIKPMNPGATSERTGIAEAEITRDASLRTSTASIAQTTSSAEYLVSQIQQHKRGFLAGLLVLVVATIGLGYWLIWNGGPNTRQIESIAVMPFVNESGNADVEYLSDGMTESLISSLSQIPNLSVKARSSVFRYKGRETNPQTIARDLNVQAVLNGRIAQRGDQLTLTLELVNAQTENVIWSEQYNRKQTDIVSLQSEIARNVSTKLKSKLSGAEEAKVAKTYTANPEAYQLYLKGLYHWNKRTAESLRTSIDYFNQAIEKDPNYAQAYAGIALAYVLFPQYSAGKPAESMPRASAAAGRALALDDTLPEAHTALANKLFYYDRNIPESDREYQRAIELNPNYATAHQWYAGGNLVATGRFEQAIAEGRRALELDPLSLIANVELAAIYGYARRNDQAIAQLRKVIEMDPNWYLGRMVLCQTYNYESRFAEAIAECEKAIGLNDDPAVLAYLARAYAESGKREEAMKQVAHMHELAKQRYVPAYGFGFVYAALGDKDLAFQWLERSLADGGWEMIFLKVDPAVDSLRSDPRFVDLLRRVGLPL